MVAGGTDLGIRCHYCSSYIGESPLHLAAMRGQVESIEIMLQNDIEPLSSNHLMEYRFLVDYIDYAGRTPLWYASARGHTETMQLLLSHEADPTVYYCRGWDCLEAFWRDSYFEDGVDLLLNWTDEVGYTILMRRISNCSLKRLSNDFSDLLLDVAESGLHNLNHQAKDGNTILTFAASHKLDQIVRILLRPEFHVDPNIPDNKGKTALMKAAEFGWDVIIDLLLNCKRTKAVLADGWTPEEDSSTEDEMV